MNEVASKTETQPAPAPAATPAAAPAPASVAALYKPLRVLLRAGKNDEAIVKLCAIA